MSERHDDFMKTKTGGALRPLQLYLHIPFCVRKCLYCDFLSGPSDEAARERYLHALEREIRKRGTEYGDYFVTSVFVGGGTPTVLSGEQLERIFQLLRKNFYIEPDAEITVEVNPGTVTEAALRCLRRQGVNRLSIGLQSASDEELKRLGRIHTWEQFVTTWQQARNVGFDNLNVDIMSNLPGQTPESYRETLEKVLSMPLPPEHISAYSLIVEEGTPFYEMQEAGRLPIPDEETDRLLYHETKRILAEHGYERYEISNYAKSGYACKHNCGYWRRREYLGLGLGAASLIGNERFQNSSDMEQYLAAPIDCVEESHVLSIEEQMEEFMFLGLRMTEGVSGERFEQCFGRTLSEVYGEVIRKNRKDGLLHVIPSCFPVSEEAESDSQGLQPGQAETQGKVLLSERGLDVSNYVMAQFLLS